MPPKKAAAASKKTEAKKKDKVIEVSIDVGYIYCAVILFSYY